MNLEKEWAHEFAREWLAAWNAGDLARVLKHYTDDFEMISPMIAEIAGESSGALVGKSKIEAYWRSALQKIPDLRFELVNVLTGAGSIVLYYKTSFGKLAAEVLFFDSKGKVYRGVAHYVDNFDLVGNQTRRFDHIDLRVRNLAEAKSFYDRLMPAIGFPNSCETSLGVAYEAQSIHPKPEFVGLIEDSDHQPSATRIAFSAATRDAVELAAQTATLAGARNVEGPMFCPEYSPTYYAFFFDDPCGNHLEICCRTAS